MSNRHIGIVVAALVLVAGAVGMWVFVGNRQPPHFSTAVHTALERPLRDPDRQVAALHESTVILWPVSNAVLGLVLRVDSGLHARPRAGFSGGAP